MEEERNREEAVLSPTVTPEGDVVEGEAPAAPPSLETEEVPVEEPTAEEPPVDYEALAAQDLSEIKRLDPAYAPAAHLSDLPFARRFAELRDLGLSVAEALAAAAPRFAERDGRAHLRQMAPRGKGNTAGTLDRTQMKEAKMLFAGLSENEINALFRRVSQKNNM